LFSSGVGRRRLLDTIVDIGGIVLSSTKTTPPSRSSGTKRQ